MKGQRLPAYVSNGFTSIDAAGKQRPPRVAVPDRAGGEALSYRLVVYNAAGGAPPPGADALLRVEVVRGEAPVFAGEWQPLSARAIRRDGKGVEVGGRLKLELPADLYTLRVSAKNPKSNKTVTQAVDFEVAP